MTKNVIITTLQCCSYSGSELHILSIAKEFVRNGYDVTVLTLEKSYPLLFEYEKEGIKVLTFKENLKIEENYDVFFAQHYVVANFLVDNYKFSFDRLVVSVLSAFHNLEELPRFASEAGKILFVSDEAMKSHQKKTGNEFLVAKDNSYVFVNYAEDEFFSAYSERKNYSLKKIAIVSNHFTPECLDLVKLAESENICVDLIGVEYQSVAVTPNFLKKYDLIITIGRTAQACFAQGIPVYVYDIFGGCGFVSEKNFERNMLFNFSGRGFERKLTGNELLKDIVESYYVEIKKIPWLRKMAEQYFNLSNNFDSFLDELMSLPVRSHCLYNYYNDVEKQEHDALATTLSVTLAVPTSQVFFDMGEGFSEKNFFNYPVRLNTEIKLVVNLPRNTRCIRFDPLSQSCKLKIISVLYDDGTPCEFSINQQYSMEDDYMCFINNDVNVYIPILNEASKFVKINFIANNIDDLLLMKQVNEFNQNINFLEQEKSALLSSMNDLSSQNKKLLIQRKQLEEIKCVLEQQVAPLNKIKKTFLWKLLKPVRIIWKFVTKYKK